jgi:hypothetical protein
MDRLVKILVPLGDKSWHGHSGEILWAQPLSDGFYSLRSIPFYALGISFADEVEVALVDSRLTFSRVVRRGGHSTYRVIVHDGDDSNSRFADAWAPLEDHGCEYERATNTLVAIDVPPSAEIQTIYRLLKAGEEAGVWDFEEGHCGHAIP